jgi:hypothetical protein
VNFVSLRSLHLVDVVSPDIMHASRFSKRLANGVHPWKSSSLRTTGRYWPSLIRSQELAWPVDTQTHVSFSTVDIAGRG